MRCDETNPVGVGGEVGSWTVDGWCDQMKREMISKWYQMTVLHCQGDRTGTSLGRLEQIFKNFKPLTVKLSKGEPLQFSTKF